ncbi:DinB family protein [Paenibacillus guangzhouensis]|uniref:DinB family protein n=1 Tax=Paenibacillus guangzhouensis TaxID=1473112 RepID=UPI001266FAB4|nr:DinB family protein [Paenibacillus guangzhouensis]
MNTRESLYKLEETANHYMQVLEQFSMEQLQRQPNEEAWSLGQMVQHLINSALYMHLRNVELCMDASGGSAEPDGVKTEAGMALFEQGSFPPVRIQVPPSPQYTPAQPTSKELLVQGLNTVIQRMREVEPTLESANRSNTVAHPRFGGMNATEWFLLIEMHYRHHLLQLGRLKEFLYA